MTASTLSIENPAAGGLLRVEPEFGIGFPALDIARGVYGYRQENQHGKSPNNSVGEISRFVCQSREPSLGRLRGIASRFTMIEQVGAQ